MWVFTNLQTGDIKFKNPTDVLNDMINLNHSIISVKGGKIVFHEYSELYSYHRLDESGIDRITPQPKNWMSKCSIDLNGKLEFFENGMMPFDGAIESIALARLMYSPNTECRYKIGLDNSGNIQSVLCHYFLVADNWYRFDNYVRID